MSCANGKMPWKARMSDTNAVYNVIPILPDHCWQWIYGCHWVVCALWLMLLLLPPVVSCYAAAVPLIWGWQLFARAHLREDLLVGRATFFLVAHFLGALGVYRTFAHASTIRLWLEVVVMWQIGGFGITCGAHRLWSHRSYVAK